jgi:hypothetical protein
MYTMQLVHAACVKHLTTISSVGVLLLITDPVAIAHSRGSAIPLVQGAHLPQAGPEPELVISRAPAEAPYVLAPANCGTNAPVLALSVLVANTGASESPARPAPVIYAIDESTDPQWIGSAPLPPINPRQAVLVNVPVMAHPSTWAMGGNSGLTHNFRVLIKGTSSNQGVSADGSPLQVPVAIPPAFCAARSSQPPRPMPKAGVAPSRSALFLGPFDESGVPVGGASRRP